jgi:hypothetical protein
LKKLTGSVWFYKPETKKTEPNRTEPKSKKPSQTKKTSQTGKIEPNRFCLKKPNRNLSI